MFKLTHKIVHSTLSNVLSYANNVNTRGHKYKLFVNRTNKLVYSAYFINRVTPIWNFLPVNCFNCDTLYNFKNKITALNFEHFCFGRA